MINEKILKIAANTKYYGLKDDYTHKSNSKNKKCGDRIKIELIIKNKILKTMRYETESCIFCEASASILANKIRSLKVNELVAHIKDIKFTIYQNDYKIPSKLKEFRYLLNKDNMPRVDCIMLPIEGVIKALKK